MKKLLITSVLLTTLGLYACNKTSTTPNNNNNPTPTPTTLKNEWEIKGNKYKMSLCMFIEPTILGAMETMPSGSNPVNNVAVYFKNKPTADGNYKVVFYADMDSLATDEVGIAVNVISNNSQYYAAGTDNVQAKVTIVNGKVDFELPETVMFTAQPAPDTTTLKAHFTEQ